MFLKKLWRVTVMSARSQSCATNSTRGRILVGIAIAFDCEIAAVAYYVGISHDPIAINHKTGPDAALEAAGIPGGLVIRFD